ncbi:3-hydroxyacyl-CoA dehydrogenase NAD-binding domain-containing protein [Rhodohalobacter sulfatireducens]|uniref:3-hydroxyacyl-CoA dehydrogenase NAD-binding domain-containing protein n=1 Tax=Rhodohalobacter sulfatireducens TaxID=2911366 RepID=A0ABS9KBA8_9BACT|nr:3-hydroxyacyl-CoA dehydrogenase NAD-binding domain-containing protein [Rhodohalobacter sulfatireducens]MCG2588154.1 3-hydroxyacyl-CoA dehydrogenase NAD-binding domain-containing protein [Rhodohalobacter sulfatireducens]
MDHHSNIGVVGAGTMGSGIAQIAATYGHEVYLFDAYKDQLKKAEQEFLKILNRQVTKDRMTQKKMDDILHRIHFVDHLKNFSDCEIVFEAIIENLQAKKDQFARLEGIVKRSCILATNTSSLSIASISSALNKPGRFLGVHFFNPAPVMNLVEIIPGISTSNRVVEKVQKLTKSWEKKTVTAKDTPGFIVNRVARPFYGEALRIYEEGIADIATIDWAMKECGEFKMGPFELMDLVGNDVNYEVTETIFKEFYYDPRFKPSFVQKRLVEAGKYGKKTGIGFYNYQDPSKNPKPTKDKKVGQNLLNRILAMLINEAADAVFMNVATIEDIDLAMKNGVNYPKGLLEWADEIGLNVVLNRMEFLQAKYGEDRYRPNPLLKQKVANGEQFYE